jgi:hypothetical protein
MHKTISMNYEYSERSKMEDHVSAGTGAIDIDCGSKVNAIIIYV